MLRFLGARFSSNPAIKVSGINEPTTLFQEKVPQIDLLVFVGGGDIEQALKFCMC